MAQFKIITILIGLVLVTVFAVQNSANVIIKFLIYHFTVSQALIIILSVAVGVVIGLMVGLTRNFKTSKNIKKLRGKIQMSRQKFPALRLKMKIYC